jgi:hypothetical protein
VREIRGDDEGERGRGGGAEERKGKRVNFFMKIVTKTTIKITGQSIYTANSSL